jgi:hypothetical protein
VNPFRGNPPLLLDQRGRLEYGEELIIMQAERRATINWRRTDVTESDWLNETDPSSMIAFVREEQKTFRTRWVGWIFRPRFNISERKWRLFYCACMRRIEHLLPVIEAQELIGVAERFADGSVSEEILENAIQASIQGCRRERTRLWELGKESPHRAAILALERFHRPHEAARTALGFALRAWVISQPQADLQNEETSERARQAALLREVVGNPFRACIIDSVWQAWNDGTIPRMAQRIYDERRFEDMPILADALEDAGCCDEAILTHCRAETGHVRGCWLLDLLTGKE